MAKEAPADLILAQIEDTLQQGGVSDVNLYAVLDIILDRFECVAGSIHWLNPASGLLKLRVQKTNLSRFTSRQRLSASSGGRRVATPPSSSIITADEGDKK